MSKNYETKILCKLIFFPLITLFTEYQAEKLLAASQDFANNFSLSPLNIPRKATGIKKLKHHVSPQ